MRLIWGILIALATVVTGCNQMAQQTSARANEDPQFQAPDGVVAVNEPLPLPGAARASDLVNRLEATAENIEAGRLAYRRYCWPCHGPELNGEFSQVGGSFPAERIDLNDPEIRRNSDGELFVFIARGTGKNPPLLGTMTETELWETIVYLRAVWAGETKPGPPKPKGAN